MESAGYGAAGGRTTCGNKAGLDLLEERDEMKEMTKRMEGWMVKHDARAKRLEDRMANIDTKMETLEDQMADINTKMETLEDRMANINTKMETLEDRMADKDRVWHRLQRTTASTLCK